MTDPDQLARLGDLSKPATTLIEKISDAIGGIFKPYQIRRIARAEADAELIRVATQIEITELQRRAVQRFFAEEARKQDNIESITSKALPEVSPEARPESIEDDWDRQFLRQVPTHIRRRNAGIVGTSSVRRSEFPREIHQENR